MTEQDECGCRACTPREYRFAGCSICGFAFAIPPGWPGWCLRCKGNHTFPHPEPRPLVGFLFETEAEMDKAFPWMKNPNWLNVLNF